VLLSALVFLSVPLLERLARSLVGRLLAPWPGQDAEGVARLMRAQRILIVVFRCVLAIAAVGLIVETWGGPVLEVLRTDMGRAGVRAAFNIGVALLLGYAAWEGSKILIDRHVGRPRPGEELQPGTRAHTLLPVLRHFALGALSVVIGLIVLSSLGVDIGPLLAGAGIVGLAIGFGAQTLVRDIVAGFFFLLDDAFRVGEYVDVGRVKGTVEGITIRSLQLRHHRGALHTIPYGQIQAISNYHRDWVIEKLEFGLAYGTDSEKVRKILKKVGQEMTEDPELKAVLLEPLKSQGVSRLTDSAMVFRAKFKTVPGQQFLVRRAAYHRIQDAFAANGIAFAQQTVRITSDAKDETEAAAAAKAVTADQIVNIR
jgi:small-conductance mechanosensitive channel